MSEYQNLGYLIKLISDTLLKLVNSSICEFGLTFQQFQVIEFIINSEGEVSQKDIESYMGVAHQTVVGLLKRMEMKNFIVCKFNPNDKRIKNVYLTKKAYRIMEEVSRMKREVEGELLLGMDEGQKNLLMSSLNTVLKNITK